MSDDLISRQAALYELHLLSIEALRKQRRDYGALIDICSNRIKSLPTAIPERKTGRWIETDDYDAWRCSECEEYFCLDEGTPQDNEYYYCPCCGAKMESDNNDS